MTNNEEKLSTAGDPRYLCRSSVTAGVRHTHLRCFSHIFWFSSIKLDVSWAGEGGGRKGYGAFM